MFYETPADFLSRLPEKLQSIVEFDALADAVNPQIDDTNTAIAKLVMNKAISTANETGIKRWEKILGVSNPLTVYKQHVIDDPYHFEVFSSKDYAYDMQIYGNTTQDGTPTPDAPITPVCLPAGTEIKLIKENWFNPSVYNDLYSEAEQAYVGEASVFYSRHITIPAYFQGKTFTFSAKVKVSDGIATNIRVAIYYTDGTRSDGNLINSDIYAETKVTSNPLKTVSYIGFHYGYQNIVYIKDVLLNPGSAPIDYNPYANPTTLTTPCDLRATPDGLYSDDWNILTGGVGRNVPIYEITGAESGWTYDATNLVFFLTVFGGFPAYRASEIFCTHYDGKAAVADAAAAYINGDLACCVRSGTEDRLYIRDDNYTDVATFKAHLAALYAAETPVTVWYANAETVAETYGLQPITLPQGVVNMVVESSNGVLPSATSLTLAEYQPDATLEARRNALKARLMTKPPINLKSLKSVIETYMGVEVEISITDSVVSVVYRGGAEVLDLDPLFATIYEMIPASLLVEVAYKYLQWLELDAQGLDFDALDALSMDWTTFERGEWIG